MLKPALKSLKTLKLLRSTNLQLLYSSSLMAVMGTSLIYPILPVIRDFFQVPEAQLGIFVSSFSFPAIFTAPLAGFLADLKGRKIIIVLCLLLYGAAGLSISLVRDFTWLVLLRILQGAACAGIMPLVLVVIGDTYTRERETQAQGMKVFMDRMGMLCFPPLAGLLVAVAWYVPFLLYGLTIPLAVFVLRFLPEPNISRSRHLPSYFKEVFALSSRLRLLIIFSISSLRFFLERAFFTYLPVFALNALGLTVAKGGFLFTIYGVGALVTSSQLGDLALRYDRIKLVALAFLVQALCLLAIPVVHGIRWLVIIMFFFGLANGIISPMHKSLLTQSAPGKLRGGVVSANSVWQNISLAVSPLIAGLIVALSSIETVFLSLGMIALVWIVAVLVLQMRGYLKLTQSPD